MSSPAAGRATEFDTLHHDLTVRSIALINSQQHASGAFPACATYPVYRYAWLRDGAFVADGMSRHGQAASATRFLDWCATVITDRADRIEDLVTRLQDGQHVDVQEFLPTRYTLDGHDGTEGWWDFQLDGYGTWLWALAEHLRRTGVPASDYSDAVRLTVRYLAATWHLSCYDWWEEHPQHVHVATLAAVAAGLSAALRLGTLSASDRDTAHRAHLDVMATLAGPGCVDGRLRKWLGSQAVDASLLAAVAPFEVVDATVAARTISGIEDDLVVERGVYRYTDDTFYGAGRWPVLAAFLGQAYLRVGREQAARDQLDWIASTSDTDGLLAEQVSDRLLHPDRYDEWVKRWGPVAKPLLWSHGQYLALAAELGVRA